MQIQKMKLADLKPADYNPRVNLEPGMDEYEKLKKSLLEFGFVDPPIYNKQTGNLVGGHQRVTVAQKIGLCDEIEVSVVDLPLDKEKALNLALNKISGKWDDTKLALLLKEFESDELELTGFEQSETEDLINQFEYSLEVEQEVIEDNFDVEQSVETISQNETISKYGDIWQLGPHRLMCGDATISDDVKKLMANSLTDLIITDPPYNVNVTSDSEALNESGRSQILNDHMSDADFDQFLLDVFKNYSTVSSDNAGLYVFHSSSYQREFENAMNAAGFDVRSQCIWVKNNATFGWSQYRWQHEPVFYAYKRKHAPSWYGDRKQTTIWRDDLTENLPSTVWQIAQDDVNKYVHPTQKPLSLIATPLRNSSRKCDNVLDLFGGSGSTLMTCDQLERSCFTMELDPIFCDVIIERWENSSGEKAILQSE